MRVLSPASVVNAAAQEMEIATPEVTSFWPIDLDRRLIMEVLVSGGFRR